MTIFFCRFSYCLFFPSGYLSGVDGLLHGDGHPDAMHEYVLQTILGLLPQEVIDHEGGPNAQVNIHAVNLCSMLEVEVEATDKRCNLVAPDYQYFLKNGKKVSQAIRESGTPIIITCGATCLEVEAVVAKEQGWYILRFGPETLELLGTTLLKTIISGGSPDIKTRMGATTFLQHFYFCDWWFCDWWHFFVSFSILCCPCWWYCPLVLCHFQCCVVHMIIDVKLTLCFECIFVNLPILLYT